MTRFEVIENETGKVDLDSSYVEDPINFFTAFYAGGAVLKDTMQHGCDRAFSRGEVDITRG